MKILIWTSYGYTKVYDISSSEKIQQIKELLITIARQNYLTGLEREQTIQQMVSLIKDQAEDVDSFEYLEISELQ